MTSATVNDHDLCEALPAHAGLQAIRLDIAFNRDERKRIAVALSEGLLSFLLEYH